MKRRTKYCINSIQRNGRTILMRGFGACFKDGALIMRWITRVEEGWEEPSGSCNARVVRS